MTETSQVATFQQSCQDVEIATTQRAFHVPESSLPPPTLYRLTHTDGEKNDTARRMFGGDECFIKNVNETGSESELEWDNYFATYAEEEGDDLDANIKERSRRKNAAPTRTGYHSSIVNPMYLSLPPPEVIYENLLKTNRRSYVLQKCASVLDMRSETFGQQVVDVGSQSSAIGNNSSQKLSVQNDLETVQKGLARPISDDIKKQKILRKEELNIENIDCCQDDEMSSKATVRGRPEGVCFSLQDGAVQTNTGLKGRFVYRLSCYTVRTTKKIVRYFGWMG
uniref:Uncharacterized protein n=2 Tax=Branchiostoma floridae TaxID=7739 RepID=C4A014_BRAFL|eukprot:XP_002585863.1 hypothetical protein BRAFLDRAFT_132923 [Branchiostoma floridae]